MLYCEGHHPKRRRPDLLWALKERCNKRGLYFFDVAFSGVLQRKDRFPARFLFYTRHFPTTHVHVERCDWPKSVKVTSSGRFDYLSVGRSRFTSLPRNQSSERVSILTSLPHLARSHALSRALPDFLGVTLKVNALSYCNCIQRPSVRRPIPRHQSSGHRPVLVLPSTRFSHLVHGFPTKQRIWVGAVK